MAQFNVRLTKHTEDQIDYLAKHKRMTQTQLAILAFDRLYQEAKREEKEKEMNMVQERINKINRVSGYTASERDAFLQAWCEVLDERGEVITADNLADAQSEYDLAACQQFIADNCNGY